MPNTTPSPSAPVIQNDGAQQLMKTEISIAKWMIARAAKFINANPENPAEVVEEITFRGNLRTPVNFSGEVGGYSIKITTDLRPGGHSATVLQGWRNL